MVVNRILKLWACSSFLFALARNTYFLFSPKEITLCEDFPHSAFCVALSITKSHFLANEFLRGFSVNRFSGLVFEIGLLVVSILIEKFCQMFF